MTEASKSFGATSNRLWSRGFALALLRGLFVFDRERFAPRQWPTAAAIAAIATLLAISIINPFEFSAIREKGLLPDRHLVHSLEMAANKALCGVDSSVSVSPRALRIIVARNSAVVGTPLRRIIETEFGPLDGYCSSSMEPFTNNENALYYLYSTVLGLWPNASIEDLGRFVTTVRMLMIGFIGFALISLGIGTAWAFVSILLGTKLHVMTVGTHLLSMYPFMAFQLAVLCGLVALGYALGSRLGWSTLLRLGYGAVLGLAVFAIWNMRTAQGMVAIGAMVFVAGLLLLRGREFATGSSRWRSVAVAALACVVVGLGLHKVLLRGIPDTGVNATYHMVAHPLVLGLAVPDNDLARRENIKWDDRVGIEIAHRIDPNATYLSAAYEQALFAYYFDLWKMYPREMLGVYAAKFEQAGVDIPRFAGDSDLWALPPRWLTESGWRFLSALIATGLLAGHLFVRFGAPAALGAAFFGFAGSLLLVEHAIVLPSFNITHFGALMEWAFLFGLGLIQAAVNLCVWLFMAAQKSLLGRS